MNFSFRESIAYCPYCATPLTDRETGGRRRPHCAQCELTFYADPKLAVAVIVESDGKIVLQRRTINPGLGRWTFPSGFVDRGERVEEAAIREVAEETGLEVELLRLLGLYSEAGNPVVVAVYVARPVGGRFRLSDETDAVDLFAPDQLPSLAFDHDARIIQDWVHSIGIATNIGPGGEQR